MIHLINNAGMTFLKNKIKGKLSEVADQMGKYQYKLAVALVEDCNDPEELKEMAELSLQMDFFSYVKNEIDPLLQEMNMTIADVRKLGVGEIPKANTEMFEIEPTELEESLDDEETTDAMAMMLFSRIANEAVEEKYREEILDFQLEDHPDESQIDDIQLDDEELTNLLDAEEDEIEEEHVEDDSDIIDESELDGFFSDLPDDEEVEQGQMSTDEIFDESGYDLDEIGEQDDDNSNADEDEDDIFADIDVDSMEFGDDIESDDFDIDESELAGFDDVDIEDESSEADVNSEDIDPFDMSSIDSIEGYTDEDDETDGDESEKDLDPFDDIDENDFLDYPDMDESSEPDNETHNNVDDDFDIDESELAGFDDTDEIDADNADDTSDEDDDPLAHIGLDDIDDADSFFMSQANTDNKPNTSNQPRQRQSNQSTTVQNRPNTPANAMIHTANKPNRSTGVRPTTVYRNGTKEGEKTQEMFDLISGFGERSVKLASMIRKKAIRAAKSKFFEIGSEHDEIISMDVGGVQS